MIRSIEPARLDEEVKLALHTSRRLGGENFCFDVMAFIVLTN